VLPQLGHFAILDFPFLEFLAVIGFAVLLDVTTLPQVEILLEFLALFLKVGFFECLRH
jgi:hypothetical protein